MASHHGECAFSQHPSIMTPDTANMELRLHSPHAARDEGAETTFLRGLHEDLAEFRSGRPTRRRSAPPAAVPPGEPQHSSPSEPPVPHPAQHSRAPLNPRQADLLRTLVLADAPVPADTLDGRVLRALQGRGLVEVVDRGAIVTEPGKSYFDARVRRRRRVGARPDESTEGTAREQRAEAIRRAARILEQVLPVDVRVEVGCYSGTAAQVVEGFRALADVVARGGLIVGA